MWWRFHSCFIWYFLFKIDSGHVYSFGYCKNGRLGIGITNQNAIKPILINGLEEIIKIHCGIAHSFAISSNSYFLIF